MTHKDVVERLRDITGWPGDHGDVGLCMEAANEIERLRLTDAEREAVEAAIAYMAPVGNYDSRVQATLRGLLKRLG